jgi:hypothetical protein
MKYLKKINLNESRSDDILDILDILLDLEDDNFVKEISNFTITRNGRLELKVFFNENHFGNIRSIEDFDTKIKNLNSINAILKRINSFTDLEFSFEGNKLLIYFKTVDGIEKILSKYREGSYISKNLPVKIDINRLPDDLEIDNFNYQSSFIINNDLSCRLIITCASWDDISKVNKDDNLQNLIIKEFENYGFNFVRKWIDENWGYEHDEDDAMWFEFYMKSVI